MNTILTTERSVLRELVPEDFDEVCNLLQDERTMYAYEGAFSDDEVREWIDRQIGRYRRDGFGLWGMVEKSSGKLIGQCGITLQQWGERTVPEVGYLLRRDFWHRGFATEAARACIDYAFVTLDIAEIFSIIRDTNRASQRVAIRNGMSPVGEFVKHYRGVDMPHIVYGKKR